MSGFMGQILRVDLTTGNIKVEPLPEKEARLFLGGRFGLDLKKR
jgi:aldehyde:ferredoxin oxidoreductase